MKKGWLVIGSLIVAMTFSITGCTLAVEGAGEETTTQDQLIGAFITTEDMTTFDWEAYLEENLEDLISKGEVSLDDMAGNTFGSDQRVYATVDRHGSDEPGDWEIYFEDLKGICFFVAQWQYGDGGPFIMMTYDDEICEIQDSYNFAGEEDEMELAGTIYILPSMYDTIYYMNPVYQTEAGDIYVVPGGMGDHIGSLELAELKTSYSASYTVTKDGKTEASKMTISITYKGAYEPSRILVHQMDASNRVVKMEEFEPGKLPEEIITEANTAYMVVETQHVNGEASTREIYTPNEGGDDYFDTFFVTEDGGLGQMSTRIMWK